VTGAILADARSGARPPQVGEIAPVVLSVALDFPGPRAGGKSWRRAASWLTSSTPLAD